MIKKMAWNTFKNTGNINTFLEFKQIEDLEKSMKIAENNTQENIQKGMENTIQKNNINILKTIQEKGEIN